MTQIETTPRCREPIWADESSTRRRVIENSWRHGGPRDAGCKIVFSHVWFQFPAGERDEESSKLYSQDSTIPGTCLCDFGPRRSRDNRDDLFSRDSFRDMSHGTLARIPGAFPPYQAPYLSLSLCLFFTESSRRRETIGLAYARSMQLRLRTPSARRLFHEARPCTGENS